MTVSKLGSRDDLQHRFLKRSNVAVLTTEVPTANHALAVIVAVEQSVGKLDFLKSPRRKARSASKCLECWQKKKPRKCLRHPSEASVVGARAHTLTISAWLRMPLVISAAISRSSFLLMFSRSS